MMENDIHSRSRLAGYTPEILFNSRVLIIGAGALGQNLALNLALAGVGEINIVDFDAFEAHNATRSPLYPTVKEQDDWGKAKAKVVARKLLPLMTALAPRVRYAIAPIQSLGDLPLIHSQLIFAAVDNQYSRTYLAQRCHVVGRPLIEGGFFAENLNVSVFGPDSDDPCYRCLSPGKKGAFSCTHYALSVEAQQAIPAIQNTAAVLGGLQAEIGIQWLHGERSMRSKMVHANIHTMTMGTVHIARAASCPGIHWPHTNLSPKTLAVGGDDTLAQLMKAVAAEIGLAEIRFPDVFVVRNFCTQCNRLTDARVPEGIWLASPSCVECGGPFSLTDEDNPVSGKAGIYTNEHEEEIVGLTCKQVGLPSGTICEIWPIANRERLGERYLMQLKGTIDDLMEEVPVQ